MSTKETFSNPFLIPTLIASIVIILGCIGVFMDNKGSFTKTYIVTSGIVTNKFAQDYACGKHKRRTCTDYYLVINQKDYLVSSTFFHSTLINSTQTLKRSYSDTPWYVSLFIILTLPAFIMLLVCSAFGAAHETYHGDKE